MILRCRALRVGDLQDQFAKVLSCEQTGQGFREPVQSLHHVFPALHAAVLQVTGQLSYGDREAVDVIEHHHALHAGAVDQQRQVILRPLHRLGVVVLADRAADDDARSPCQARQHVVQDFATDVVEVDVHAFRAVLFQSRLDTAALVVDAGVETELIHHPVAFGAAAGNAHDAAALDLGQLPHGLTDSASSARHHDGVAGPRLPDVQQAEITGHAGKAQYIHPLPDTAQPRVDLKHAAALDLLLRDRAIFLHAQVRGDEVPSGE